MEKADEIIPSRPNERRIMNMMQNMPSRLSERTKMNIKQDMEHIKKLKEKTHGV